MDPGLRGRYRHGLFVDTDMARRANWNAVANTPIEREQMAQMMYNALIDVGTKLPSYEEYSEVALGINDIIDCDNYDAVATCYAIKLLSGTGNGNFAPHDPMTRAQAAVVLCNIYGYVTGDVTGTVKPDETTPTVPVVPEKPSGAVGGHYDTSIYDVPADTNKDGWITEAEVQAVLNQLRIDYPDGSPWGSSDHWYSPVMGNGWECAGFAYMVSDKIFGSLPKYEVSLEQTRVGDVMKDGPTNHKSIVLNDYGKLVFEGVNYTDQTIPELDKLITLSKLFGLTVGQLLGVEQPAPASTAVPNTPKWIKALLAGLGAAVLILAVTVGALWSQVLTLNRRTVLEEEYVITDRAIFQTAECQLSEIELGFPQARGDQVLTLNFTLKPVKELKNWTVIGLIAYIEGRDPWGQHPDGTPISREEREWNRTENIPASRGTASLTLPDYGGESVAVYATLREKGTGRTIGTADPVFTLTAESERAGDFFVTGIQVEENTAPQAGIPKSIALALPDPRFDG